MLLWGWEVAVSRIVRTEVSEVTAQVVYEWCSCGGWSRFIEGVTYLGARVPAGRNHLRTCDVHTLFSPAEG